MIYLPQVGCFSILSGSLLCCCLYCPMLATCMRNQQLTNTQLRVISTTLQASWKKHADILQHTLWHISWHIFGQFRCLHLDKILTEQLWQFCWYLYLNLNCNKFADTLMLQYLTIRDILSFSDRSIFCDSYSDDIYIIYIYICSKKRTNLRCILTCATVPTPQTEEELAPIVSDSIIHHVNPRSFTWWFDVFHEVPSGRATSASGSWPWKKKHWKMLEDDLPISTVMVFLWTFICIVTVMIGVLVFL